MRSRFDRGRRARDHFSVRKSSPPIPRLCGLFEQKIPVSSIRLGERTALLATATVRIVFTNLLRQQGFQSGNLGPQVADEPRHGILVDHRSVDHALRPLSESQGMRGLVVTCAGWRYRCKTDMEDESRVSEKSTGRETGVPTTSYLARIRAPLLDRELRDGSDTDSTYKIVGPEAESKLRRLK